MGLPPESSRASATVRKRPLLWSRIVGMGVFHSDTFPTSNNGMPYTFDHDQRA